MLRVNFNTIDFNRAFVNVSQYGYGFLDGIDMEKITFNRFLGGFTAEALGQYIDAMARMNPSSLHHVYEWGATGSQSGRLFKFNVDANKYSIIINGSFLPSKSVSPTGTEPFVNKAEIMENGISVTIRPKNSPVLVFEDDGETVFTASDVYVAHPGGPAVENSFANAIEMFFGQYFTNALLSPLLKDLETADEFVTNFGAAKNGGRPAGVRAGRQYYRITGEVSG